MRSFILLCLLTLTPSLNTEQGVRIATGKIGGPLPVEVANGAKSFAPLDLDVSPDGLWVAYTLLDPRRRKIQARPSDQLSFFNCSGAPYFIANSDVLITNTRTGETINISTGRGANWSPSWSPDGKSLAFYSDRTGKAHVWIWQRSAGTLRELTTVVVHVRLRFEKIIWTRDGRQVITKVRGVGQTLDDCFDGSANQQAPDASARVVYDSQKPNTQLRDPSTSYLADLAIVDVATGRTSRIVRQQKIVGYSLSPTGDKLAYASPRGLKPNDEYLRNYDLIVVSFPDLQMATVPEFLPGIPSLPVSWSPDGRSLAYLSDRECFVWNINAGPPQKVTFGPKSGFVQTPLWDKEGRSVYLIGDNRVWKVSTQDAKAIWITEKWDRQIRSIIGRQGGNEFWSSDAGRSLYVKTLHPQSKREGFYKLDLQSAKLISILETDDSYALALNAVSTSGNFIVFASENAQRDQNLWIADQNFAHRRQLTHINPELERHPAGAARLLDYSDAEGRKLQATLLLPVNYDENTRYPLIVWVYGGSMLSANVNRYGSTVSGYQNMQLLASRRYAVLLPDAPLRVGTPMEDLVKTVLPAVDKTIEIGIADATRLGVMGTSYGGYSTLALITQTPRFKAAVMDVGLGNLISRYGSMLKSGAPFGVGWAEEGQGRMGGPPWQFPDRYVKNSPVFYLDKVQTPLLINQGGMDITPFQSDEVFVGLRRLGKKVVYVRYENEGHGIEHYDNRVDYWNRVINWFDSNLNKNMRFTPSAR